MSCSSLKLSLFLGRHETASSGMWVYAITLAEEICRRLGPCSQNCLPAVSFAGPSECSSKIPADWNVQRRQGVLGSRRGGFFRDLLTIVPEGTIFHGLANATPLLGGGKIVLTMHDLFQGYPWRRPHGWYQISKMLLYRLILRMMITRADKIITDHPSVAAEIVQRYGERFTPAVVYPPLARQYLNDSTPQAASREKLILAFCSLDSRKNFAGILAGFLTSSCSHDHTLAVVVSSDRAEQFCREMIAEKTRAEDANVSIRIEKRLSETELVSLYRRSAAVLFPSFAEGFGYPIYEALSQGTAVVCSRQLLIPEVDSFIGSMIWLCDPHDIDSIAAALNQQATSGQQEHVCDAAARTVTTLLTPENATFKLIQIYKELSQVS